MKKAMLAVLASVSVLGLAFPAAAGNVKANGAVVNSSISTSATRGATIGSVTNKVKMDVGATKAMAPKSNNGNVKANGAFVGSSVVTDARRNGKIKDVGNAVNIKVGNTAAETY